MREHQAEIERRGARIAALGLGDSHFARAFIAESGITFPLLVDEERKAYAALELKQANAFHIFRKDNMRRRREAKAAQYSEMTPLEFVRQRRIKKNPFQLGGSFVFGPGNVDRFVHISETFSDNASPASLLAALP